MNLIARLAWVSVTVILLTALPLYAQDAEFERIGPFGGSVLAVEADPSGAVWAAMYSHRVFRSDDSGQTWFLSDQHYGFAGFTPGLDGELYGQLNEWGGPFVEWKDDGRTWSPMTVRYTVLQTGETSEGALFALIVTSGAERCLRRRSLPVCFDPTTAAGGGVRSASRFRIRIPTRSLFTRTAASLPSRPKRFIGPRT